MLRRSFLGFFAGAAAARALSAAGPALALGYDTYSIRSFNMKAMDHLDFAAGHGLDAIQLSSLSDFESLDPSHLAKVRQRAAELNLLLDGGAGCICPSARAWRAANGDPAEYLAKAIRVSAAIGARSVRCYLGDSADRLGPDPIEKHMENTIRVLKANRRLALDSGVKIALENHSGDLQAWEVKTIIEESGKDAVGACLDTGNPIWAVEDPAVTFETLGPLVVTTHVRDTAIFEHPRGCAAHWTALGDGSVDFQHLAALHQRLCPAAPMHLEIITGRPPRLIPYLEPEFWKAFPKARAAEFARFLALVKRGSPLMKNMVIADGGGPQPEECRAALKRQQMVDLKRSLDYARTKLGAGRRRPAA